MNSYNGFTPSQRMKAYRWLMNEYAIGGRIKPFKCDSCAITEGVIEPHSENYGEPYGNHIGQYGLCYRCHMMLHCRFSSPKVFTQYAQDVANGKQYEPFYKRDFFTFKQHHLIGTTKPTAIHVFDSTNLLSVIAGK
jgi:hypothetical protein